MRHNNLFARLAFVLAVSCLVPSCVSAPPAPHGFTLAVQLMHVNIRAVDSMRILFAPVMEPPGAMMGHFLQPTDGTSFDDGAIMVSVDTVTGLLTMTITGAYIASHAMVDASGNDPRIEIEIWSDDHMMHMPPQVRATVMHNGNQIATGVGYLPTWPLVLGGTQELIVPCGTGLDMQCAGLI